MVRISLLSLLLVSQFAWASAALARNNANLSRDQIRSMHILDRPSRPGHFYGNAVRRKHSREAQSGPVRTNSAGTNQGSPYQGYYGSPYGDSYQTGETIIYSE